jgi:hypothetical protein
VQVVTNARLIKRESRIGGLLLGVTFLLLGAGLVLSLEQEQWAGNFDAWAPVAMTYAIVIVGMVFYYLGNNRLRRYGVRYRQDGRLRHLLKGLDERYVLYTFLGKKLPDYILVGPNGVHVLTPRIQEGEITCQDDRWKRTTNVGIKIFTSLYGNPMGNPSYDTAQGVQRVQALVEEKLPEGSEKPPISGLVVFTGDKVRLRVERCSFPATTGKELRKVIGRLKGRVNQAQLAQLRGIFGAAQGA